MNNRGNTEKILRVVNWRRTLTRIFAGLAAIFAADMFAVGVISYSPALAEPLAYVASGIISGTGTVSVIDTATQTVVATVPVGSLPFGVAITPDGTQVYVTNGFSGSVSVIDTATQMVVATVPVGGGSPLGVVITPDGTQAYLTDIASVAVIDTATQTVVATVPVGSSILGVAITPDGTQAYVTNLVSASVAVIDTATQTVVATIPVTAFPNGVAITPITNEPPDCSSAGS